MKANSQKNVAVSQSMCKIIMTKLPSQHPEYVATKVCLYLDRPSLVNSWFFKSLTWQVRPRKLLFTMLLITWKQIQKRMLQFPRACARLLWLNFPANILNTWPPRYVYTWTDQAWSIPDFVSHSHDKSGYFCQRFVATVQMPCTIIIMVWSQSVPSIFQKYDQTNQRLCYP